MSDLALRTTARAAALGDPEAAARHRAGLLRAGLGAPLWDRCRDMQAVLDATRAPIAAGLQLPETPGQRASLRATCMRIASRSLPGLVEDLLLELQRCGWWDDLRWHLAGDCAALAWLAEEELLERWRTSGGRDPRFDPQPGDRVEGRQVVAVERRIRPSWGRRTGLMVEWRGWRASPAARLVYEHTPQRRGPADPPGRPRDLAVTSSSMLASSWRAWAAGRRVYRRAVVS